MKTVITFTADNATFANIQFAVSTVRGLMCVWSSSGQNRTATAEALPPHTTDRLDALAHQISNAGASAVSRTDGG